MKKLAISAAAVLPLLFFGEKAFGLEDQVVPVDVVPDQAGYRFKVEEMKFGEFFDEPVQARIQKLTLNGKILRSVAARLQSDRFVWEVVVMFGEKGEAICAELREWKQPDEELGAQKLSRVETLEFDDKGEVKNVEGKGEVARMVMEVVKVSSRE